GGEGELVVAPHEAGPGAEDQREAQGDDQDVPVGGAEGPPDDGALDDQGQDRRGQHGDPQGGSQRQAAGAGGGPADEGGDHQHLALGEVERAGRVVDDDQ